MLKEKTAFFHKKTKKRLEVKHFQTFFLYLCHH